MSAEGDFGAARDLGSVAIVGAGQVGTTLGMALVEAGPRAGVADVRIFDRVPATATASMNRGAAHRTLSGIDEALEAETIVLAIPVHAILWFLEELGDRVRPGSFLIDTGSSKVAVVEAMRRRVPDTVHALGGHPMAGTEVAGPEGAEPALYRGAPFALVPVRDDPEAAVLGRLLVRAVGAIPVEVDPQTHDRTVARTSHLPHLVAYAMVGVARDAVASGTAMPVFMSSGFVDATRLAGSDPHMVAGFLWANAAEVRRSVAELTGTLAELAAAMADGPDRLAGALDAARTPTWGKA